MGGLRELAAPFVVPGPSGVAVRDRLKHLTAEDELLGITIVAVDPAYTSRWGAQHWQKPLTGTNRK
ncbi:hypothetical protein, partial [Streptomyces sp. NPDC020996]|uniref:hypothetical protein n=1 Tax=Streptomyces sp. NPDC020996 TaxID=3154791 RepID=UPI003407A706